MNEKEKAVIDAARMWVKVTRERRHAMIVEGWLCELLDAVAALDAPESEEPESGELTQEKFRELVTEGQDLRRVAHKELAATKRIDPAVMQRRLKSSAATPTGCSTPESEGPARTKPAEGTD